MRKTFCFFLFSILFSTSLIRGEESLGYVSHSTINIGDDFQSIAVKRFLPGKTVPVDREFINEFDYNSIVKTVVSGWFMHDVSAYWDLKIPPPKKSWPPSSKVDPFFISIHFTGTFFPTVFSDESVEYLKEHAPIGARDLFTLDQLQQRDIPSYYSGCLTLTLENTCKERNNIIYLVDIDEKSANYIKSKVKSPVIVLTHGKTILQYLSLEHRLIYAEHLLDIYRRAKCVVTTRLHASMPCLAFETPLLFLNAKQDSLGSGRFSGLADLAWHCSWDELCNGEVDYDFDNPPENPKDYIPIREDLIKRMTEWVNSNS